MGNRFHFYSKPELLQLQCIDISSETVCCVPHNHCTLRIVSPVPTVPLKCKLPLSREKQDSYRKKRDLYREK